MRLFGVLVVGLLVAALPAPAAVAQTAATPAERAAYLRALYPGGLPMRVNPFTDADTQAEFALESRVAMPDMMRQVIVYSERFIKDAFSDNAYWVFIALVERNGATLRVLDRHEVTGDLTLYTEFPGNFVEFGALVTPIAARDSTIAAIELWTTLAGTGSVTRGGHFFYVVSPAGWDAFETSAKANCGPSQTIRYRFNGSTYEQAPGPGAGSAGRFTQLPVSFKQATCAN